MVVRATRSSLRFAVSRPPYILHIGKTGGNSLKELLAALTTERRRELGVGRLPVILPHSESRLSEWPLWKRRASFMFVYRDPVDRYVSGFYSRLRQGRPTSAAGSRLWSSAEAAAFKWFNNPNDCFEALDARDQRVRSAALFAFSAIMHLRRDHAHYLGQPQDWLARSRRALYFCPLPMLSANVHRFFRDNGRLNVDGIRKLLPVAHASTDTGTHISERAIRNLIAHRPAEFKLFEILEEEYAVRNR